MSIERFVLDNGLTVLAEQMRSAPVVALQAWVRVGAADEPRELAGAAHLHEHMLFKGTERRGAGEIARTVEASGGEINAWTSFDQTVYHVVLGSQELDTGLDILSDALRNSLFDADELSREIEVVCEEIRRANDAPSRRVSRSLFELVYQGHPYRYPVLGTEESVRGMTRDAIVGFYRRHYRPTAVTVVAVGDFETGELRRLLEKRFGDWEPSGSAEPLGPRVEEAPQSRIRAKVLREDVQEARLALAWQIPGVEHDDVPAIDVLSAVLGRGEPSKLFQHVRRQRELVNDVSSYAYTPKDPGVFIVGAGLKSENLEPALEAILSSVYDTRERLLSNADLERVKVMLLSDSAYQRETVQGQARKLGFYEVVAGDYRFEEAYRERLRGLTVDDLRDVARRYITDAPSMVVQLPAEDCPDVNEERLSKLATGAFEKSVTQRPKLQPGSLDVVRVEIPNGPTLLLLEEDRPVVALRAVGLGGSRREPRSRAGIAQLFSAMWGLTTQDYDAPALSRRIAQLGGGLTAFSGRNTAGMRGEVIRERAQEGLELFCDAIVGTRFLDEDFRREQAISLERIRVRQDNPARVAFDAFSSTLFPTHPFGVPGVGTPETVAALTTEDLEAMVRRTVTPEKLVVSVVGGIDVDTACGILERGLVRDDGTPHSEPLPQDAAPTDRVEIRKTMDREQAHVVIGSMGLTLDDDDRYALEVLMTVLSGQGGRLFMDLRDRQSLAYSVSGNNVEAMDPGYVYVHMATANEKVGQAVAGLHGHLDRVCEEAISSQELERAHRYLVGTAAIDLQRCGSRAMIMALDERLGLNYDHHIQYPDRVRGVTAQDVQRVAQRVFGAQGRVEVVVGRL